MKSAALYVFDDTSCIDKFVRWSAKDKSGQIFLCPVTTNQDMVALTRTRLASLEASEVKTLPYLDYFNKISFSERENFIKFISELGSKNNHHFKYKHSDFSVWWTSSIVEKNQWRDSSYHNLVKLLAILRLTDEHGIKEIMVDVGSPELSAAIMDNGPVLGYKCTDFRHSKKKSPPFLIFVNFLKASKYWLYFMYKLIILSVNTRGQDSRKEILKNIRYAVFTYFPLVDKESSTQNRFVNKYYNALQSELEDRYRDGIIWFAITYNIGGLSFKKAVELGRRFNLRNGRIYFVEEWLTLIDALSSLAEYVSFAGRFFKKISAFSEGLKYSNSQINIWSLFEDDFFSSFAGSALMNGIFFHKIFRNISNEIKEKTIVLYPLENKAWERALNFVFHERDVKTVGILHTAISLLLLQFFDYRDDLREDLRTASSIPLPARIACYGKSSLELLKKSGWSDKKIFLLSAIRYQHLKEYLKSDIPWNNRENKVLVVLSVNRKELREMLIYIHQAFNGKTDYQVILKEHYLYPVKLLVRSLGINFDSDTFVVSNDNIMNFLSSAKAAIVASSSAALESIAVGCPVIVPRLSSVVDMNPLSGVSDLAVYSNSPAHLRKIVDDYMRREEGPLAHERRKNFIENYFDLTSTSDNLVERIENSL
ncbi:MAG: hypothetical protein A2987_06650 [Omnitrophica bacterium RIFCSPLOWO2_01_FULL_45_10]|nr:MAG: hypothetical protein A2987_06650 [Omnitrophica bacterium RIFCSPLOWO2_01_FULL_45_10]